MKHIFGGNKTEKAQATLVRIQNNKTETTVSAICCPPRHITTSDEFRAILLLHISFLSCYY